jgi:flavodoxin
MNVGIMVYSKTGNTLSVAEKLKERLEKEGHFINIKKIEPVNSAITDPNKINIKNIPNLAEYDILIFGSPVHGFTLAPVFKAYLQKLSSLKGKRVFCYVTKALPTKNFGGNKAIDIMEQSILSHGGLLENAEIINWKNHEIQIAKLTEKFAKIV